MGISRNLRSTCAGIARWGSRCKNLAHGHPASAGGPLLDQLRLLRPFLQWTDSDAKPNICQGGTSPVASPRTGELLLQFLAATAAAAGVGRRSYTDCKPTTTLLLRGAVWSHNGGLGRAHCGAGTHSQRTCQRCSCRHARRDSGQKHLL